MSNDLTTQRSPGRRSHDCVPGVAAQLLVFNTTSREGRFFYFFLLCLVISLFFWHWPLRADASVWNEVARSCQKDRRYLVDQCRLRGTGVALYQTHTEDRLNINRPPTAGTHVHSHRDSLPCVCLCVCSPSGPVIPTHSGRFFGGLGRNSSSSSFSLRCSIALRLCGTIMAWCEI